MDSQNALHNIFKNEINLGRIQLGYYADRGKVAVVTADSKILDGLKDDPTQSINSQAAFLMMDWLTGKSRLPHHHRQNFILSAIEEDALSPLHPSHNLFIDRFNSPHRWLEGEERASQQLADALLPSGQWHRHYDVVILPADATNKQVTLIRHWMTLTGGSVLVLHDDQISYSTAIKQLILDTTPIQQKENAISLIHENISEEISSGITVYIKEEKELIKVAQLDHLQEEPTHLPHQPTKTEWVFKTFVKIPKNGDFTFVADTDEKSGDIQFEVGDKTVTFKKQAQMGEVKLTDLKAGEIYPIKVTTKTNGTPPRLRLGWCMPNSQKLAFIPQEAFSQQSHQPAIKNKQIDQEAYTRLNTTPLEEIMASNSLSSGFHQIVNIAPKEINQLHLTNQLIKDAEYFSVKITNSDDEPLLTLNDIPLTANTTWQQLAKDVEYHINQRISPASHPISVHYDNGVLKLEGHGIKVTQFQLRKSQSIEYVENIPSITVERPQNTAIQYYIPFDLEQLNCLTHVSMAFSDNIYGRNIELKRAEFKPSNIRFASPEEFADYLQAYLRHTIHDQYLNVSWDKYKQQLMITDYLNRSCNNLRFGYQEQTFPIAIAENTFDKNGQLVMGEITGRLPQHADIASYQLLEKPKSGNLAFNQKTGEWHYKTDPATSFSDFDQFDFIANLKDGSQSAPMSIQIQSEKSPTISYSGKRTFHIPDPIYQEPKTAHHPVPANIQFHGISLTQTHEQPIDSPYLRLIANRWALIKVDLTSETEAFAPDIIAIIHDKEGYEVGRVQLTGPEKLPKQQQHLPIQPTVNSNIANQHSYVAPLKGSWIKPGISIQLHVAGQPITAVSNAPSHDFSPLVSPEKNLVAHISNHTLYQTGKGLYANSPFSWGLEATAKLPINQLTLYNTPSETNQPTLFGFIHSNSSSSALTMPLYDKQDPLVSLAQQQMGWAYQRSVDAYIANNNKNELYYTAIEPSAHCSTKGYASPYYGGGIAQSDVMWHEVFGHGLGLPHTTVSGYPYPTQSNGPHVAYDQSRQSYITYKSLGANQYQVNEVSPAMSPFLDTSYKAPYDAFVPHSAYYNSKIQDMLESQPIQNITDQEVPIYWINGHLLKLANSQNHPYNHIDVTKTQGHLSKITTKKQDEIGANTPSKQQVVVTYATKNGLTTDTYFIEKLESINLNIADKGELVRIDFLSNDNQAIYSYRNPDALANRLFSQWDNFQLILDDYWHGGKLFWSATEPQLIDFSNGKVNTQKITKDSALCATWIEDGQCYQQYFPLTKPWEHTRYVNTTQAFIPLNHLELQENTMDLPFEQFAEANTPLLSDVYLNQTVDISNLQLPKGEYHYWAVLLVENEQGDVLEQTPLEQWQITQQNNQLSIVGTIDSTPSLLIKGVKVYIDKHLQDNTPPSSITLMQQTYFDIVENRDYLEYNRPVVFSTIDQRPELIAGMAAQEYSCTPQLQRCPQQTTSCHFFAPSCQI